MNFFDIAYGFNQFFRSANITSRYGVFDVRDKAVSGAPEPTNMSTVFKCVKVLSENVSRIPKTIQKDGKDVDHWADERINRPNSYQNCNQFWSTVESNRSFSGNALIDIRNKKEWHIIPTECWQNYKLTLDGLEYEINWKLDSQLYRRKLNNKDTEWLKPHEVLHFKGLSDDGIVALSPIAASMINMKIQSSASQLINTFYHNNAMPEFAMQSKIDTPMQYKSMKEGIEALKREGKSIQSKGGFMTLPPNTELKELSVNFGDAELIGTLKFTRDEICSIFGIPSYMMNDKTSGAVEMDIEQQSLSFRTFTIAPIIELYKQELERKLFTYKEVKKDKYEVYFDVDVLIEMDLKKKIDSYTTGITKGLMTPNEAIKKIGGEKIEEAYGDYHYLQAQYLPVEKWGEINPAMNPEAKNPTKDDPNLKTMSKKDKDNTNNKDDTK